MSERNKKQSKTQKKPMQHKTYVNNAVVDSIINQPPSDTDPNGSYTGKPVDQYDTPIQDADDL